MITTIENDDFRMGFEQTDHGIYVFDLRLAEPDRFGIRDGKIHHLCVRKDGYVIAEFSGNDWVTYPRDPDTIKQDYGFVNKVIDKFN